MWICENCGADNSDLIVMCECGDVNFEALEEDEDQP